MRFGLMLLVAVALVGALLWWLWRKPRVPTDSAVQAAYAQNVPAATSPLMVYHLGHSLVGRDMPAMLAQLAGQSHEYNSQLGWGTSMREHWEPSVTINGFDRENAHARYRDARDAVASGDYDAVILTEMVELKDAIRYHDSPTYFAKWANLARQANPDTRVYLYETWHSLDDPAGWLQRIDGDLGALWENRLLLPDLAQSPARPAYVIPAGQVLAQFTRKVEAAGGIGGIAGREDLFGKTEDGLQDMIHLSDLGTYLVALTHYAVLYGKSPVGLPHALMRADGTPADAPSAQAAHAMQQTVWDVVTGYPKTGIAQ